MFVNEKMIRCGDQKDIELSEKCKANKSVSSLLLFLRMDRHWNVRSC